MVKGKVNVAYRLGERLGAEKRQIELERIRELVRDIQVNVEYVLRAFESLAEGKGEQGVETSARLLGLTQWFEAELADLGSDRIPA